VLESLTVEVQAGTLLSSASGAADEAFRSRAEGVGSVSSHVADIDSSRMAMHVQQVKGAKPYPVVAGTLGCANEDHLPAGLTTAPAEDRESVGEPPQSSGAMMSRPRYEVVDVIREYGKQFVQTNGRLLDPILLRVIEYGPTGAYGRDRETRP
jgi:hypothetical protein